MRYFNRVRVFTDTVGQGTLTLGFTVGDNFLTPSEAGAVTGDTPIYVLEESTNVEVGWGALSGSNLTRNVIVSKISNVAGTTKINLSGTGQVRFVGDASAFRRGAETKSSGFTAGVVDRGKVFVVTAGATMSLTAAATLGNDWFCHVLARGGAVVIDPNASELIEGASTFNIPNGGEALIRCTGTAFVVESWLRASADLITGVTEAAQDAVGNILSDAGDIDFTYNDATPLISATIKTSSVIYAKMQDVVGLSVIGRAANTTGVVAAITAATDGHVLRRSGTAIGFGQLAAGAFANGIIAPAMLNDGSAFSVLGRSASTVGARDDIAAADHQVLRRSGTVMGFGAVNLSQAAAVTGTLPIALGGTGGTTAATARTSLGLAIGINVQAWDVNLDQIAALAITDGNFIVANGTAWVAESGATVRTSLGLGSLALLNTINDANWSGTVLSVINGGSGASTAAGARTNFGLGTAATASTGTTGAVLVFANGANNWTGSQNYGIGSWKLDSFSSSGADSGKTNDANGVINSSRGGAGADVHYVFYNSNGGVGNITTTGSGTLFNETSDARLKQIIGVAADKDPVIVARVWGEFDQMKVYDFIWKGSGARGFGPMAQEMAKVAPWAVSVGGEDPKIHPWSWDGGKLMPHVIVGMQDLNKRVAKLEEAAL